MKKSIWFAVLCAGLAPLWCEANATLWQIGQSDNNTAEFAFAPANYQAYREPGFFVVGASDAKKDWPYVQPGTIDGGWAPGTPQTYDVLFGLKAAPAGDCRLVVDFADTHSIDPPKLRVTVNDQSWEYQTPKGGGDASVFGNPAKGREHVIAVTVPAGALRTGDNRVSITTVKGSWVLWDALRFEAPAGTELAPASGGTVIRSATVEPSVLRWYEGRPAHGISVGILHLGEPTGAELRVGDLKMPVELRPGAQTIEVSVPAVKSSKTLKVILVSAEKTVAGPDLRVDPVRNWEVHLVHQTHLDIGFTHTQEHVLKIQVQHLKTALRFIEETKDYPPEARFIWHPEGMWAVEEFMRVGTEDEKKTFVEACRNGQVHLDILYAQAMTGMYNDEELFELLSAAKRFEKKYGVHVVSAMQSDVPGYTWGLAAALAHHEAPYISVGPNWFANGGPNDYFRPGKIAGRTHRGGRVFRWADQPFWWVSPSGKHKVFFFMPGWGYSGFHGSRGAINRDKIMSYLGHLEGKGYPYEIVMWRYGIGADNGPPFRALPDVVKAWNEKYASPRLIIARNSDVLKKFATRYGDEIPVLKGDYTPYWEDGSASTSKATGVNRAAAEKLAQVQTLWSMLNPGLSLHERVDVAWNKMVMYDEHTWGAHCSISQPDSPFSIQQDKYKQAYAFDALTLTDDLLEDVTAAVSKAGSSSIDVYNTGAWPRGGLVLLSKEQSRAGDQVKDAQGRPIPSQRLASGELAFVAREVPSFGAARYTVRAGKAHAQGKAKAEGLRLGNGLLALEVDAQSGAIKHLRKTGLDVELVDQERDEGLNNYLYILGRDAAKGRSRVTGPVKVVVEDAGPLVATLRVESDAPGCGGLIRRVRLVDGFDYVELINTTDKLKERRPEGVYFGFPFNVPDSTMRVDVPWAVVEMEKSQLPGANRNFCCVQRWVDVSNKDYGVTWATLDAPVLQFDPIKIALPFGIQYFREHFEPNAYLNSWVMNNHWECNYKAYQQGKITFRYAIRPHAGDYNPVAAQRFGRDICQPLLAVSADPASAVRESLLEVDGDGVVITSIRPCRYGKGLLVRLFNVADRKQTARLKWNCPVGATWISNPMEDKKEKAPSRIEMVPFEIVTLRVEKP